MSTSLFDLTGRVALVTGSTSGIGAALARGLASAGATVIVNGRDETRVGGAVEAIRAEDLKAEGAAFDVTSGPAVAESVARIERDVGPIDILVNNAGIQRRKPILDMEEEVWEEVLRTNLTSAFLVGRAVARGMVARERGKIVNIASVMSEVARPSISPYVSAKGGLKQLTRAMAVEWARHNVQVNGIGPGYIATPLNRALLDDPAFDSWVKARTPAGRWGRPEELVGATVFLSSAASDFVNGQIFYVDGGFLAGV